MSNESKIGILAIVAMSLLIWGYQFIKGKNILTSSNQLYVEYEQVDQLAASAPVFINGFAVGIVNSVDLKQDMSTILVTLDIEKGVKIHKGAVAEIISGSIMGGKAIRIVNNDPCGEGTCTKNGDYINGRTIGMLGSIIPQEEMSVYLDYMKENLGEVYDSLNAKIRDTDPDNEIGKSIRDLQGSLANLKSTTDQMNTLMQSSSGKLSRSLGHMESLSETLASNNDKINNILDNVSTMSNQFKDLDLKSPLTKADSMLAKANVAVEQLNKTMTSADVAIKDVQKIMAGVNNGEGTLGLLAKDEQLYHNLNNMSQSVDSLLSDIEAHPYLYVPLKSRRKVNKWRDKDEKDGN